jgi:hypothetical protein
MQAEVQLRLDEVRTTLETKKHEFDEYRTKLKTQFEEKESEVKANVEQWKTDRELKKLEHRADEAEEYAATVTFLAIAMVEEAEEATLSAIAARIDAENVEHSPV